MRSRYMYTVQEGVSKMNRRSFEVRVGVPGVMVMERRYCEI